MKKTDLREFGQGHAAPGECWNQCSKLSRSDSRTQGLHHYPGSCFCENQQLSLNPQESGEHQPFSTVSNLKPTLFHNTQKTRQSWFSPSNYPNNHVNSPFYFARVGTARDTKDICCLEAERNDGLCSASVGFSPHASRLEHPLFPQLFVILQRMVIGTLK